MGKKSWHSDDMKKNCKIYIKKYELYCLDSFVFVWTSYSCIVFYWYEYNFKTLVSLLGYEAFRYQRNFFKFYWHIFNIMKVYLNSSETLKIKS